MEKIKQFEDILSWQKAKLLSIQIYQVFSNSKDYSFKDQIQRASVSIMNNIAEGYERSADKQFSHFLYIAKGSAAEVRSMLYLARDLKIINTPTFETLYNETLSISKLLSGLIKKMIH